MADDPDRELEALLDERRAANPRRSPGRDPVGATTTRRLLGLTVAAVASSTLVLLLVLLLA